MLDDVHGEAVRKSGWLSVWKSLHLKLKHTPDDYGVPGSEFTNIEVVELGEIKVFDANGQSI